MYTVDASVWVNSFDQRESGSEISQNVLKLLRDQIRPIVIPDLALVGVAGSVSRTRQNPAQALAFAIAIGRLPNVTLVALDDKLTLQAATLAAEHGLRGADAVYGAVAMQTGCTLISLDREHLTRLTGIVRTLTPADTLSELLPATPDADAP